eukprot:gene1232-4441_t
MVFVLVIGDFHIPHRANAIPEAFAEKLMPGKIQHILCTGNLVTRDTFDYLKTLASDVHVVAGDFDEITYPEEKIVTIGDFKIGLCHGHKIVPWGDVRSQLMFEANTVEGCLLLNPGSATGAYSPIQPEVHPSFALMDIQLLNLFNEYLNYILTAVFACREQKSKSSFTDSSTQNFKWKKLSIQSHSNAICSG